MEEPTGDDLASIHQVGARYLMAFYANIEVVDEIKNPCNGRGFDYVGHIKSKQKQRLLILQNWR